MKTNYLWIAIFVIACGDEKAVVTPPVAPPPVASSVLPPEVKVPSGPAASAPVAVPTLLNSEDIVARTALSGEAPSNVRFDICNAQLCIRNGGDRVDSGVNASAIHKVKKTKTGYIVTYAYLGACIENERTFEISTELLAARFDNARGLKRHKRKDYAAAAGYFAAALEREPGFELARTNLACALSLLGKREEAAAVLFEKEDTLSLSRYWKILFDEDLAVLRDHPRVIAAAPPSPPPADFGFTPSGEATFGVAWSPKKHAIAFVSTYQSWGCSVYQHSLELHDTLSGDRLLRKPIVLMNETDPMKERVLPGARAAVRERAETATRFLANLGFHKVPDAERHNASIDAAGSDKNFRLPLEKAVVKVDSGGVRILQHGKVVKELKETAPLGTVTGVTYLPAVKALLISTYVDEPEGCDFESDIDANLVVPIDLSLNAAGFDPQ